MENSYLSVIKEQQQIHEVDAILKSPELIL